MVNFEWYRTFVSIYQTGNLTRASEELLISQPNVSIQLAALESYIGQKLFIRKPRILIPTEYGKILYSQLVDSVEHLEKVETSFKRSILQRQKQLRIGSPIEFGCGPLIDGLKNVACDVFIDFGIPDFLQSKLENNELDFYISTQNKGLKDICYEPFMDEEFYLVGGKGTDYSKLEELISNKDFGELEKILTLADWVAYDNKLSIIRRFWKNNFGKRPLIKPRFIIPNMDGISRAVGAGYGLTVMSNFFINFTTPNLVVLWKGHTVSSNKLYLVYKENRVDETQLHYMRKILKIDNK